MYKLGWLLMIYVENLICNVYALYIVSLDVGTFGGWFSCDRCCILYNFGGLRQFMYRI